MDALTVLNDIRIASPCPASWDEMDGDDRSRFCGGCRKHVFNIAGIPAAEAVALIERNEGRLCLRLYRRRDGTVLTADCPVGVRSRAMRRLRRVAVGSLVGMSVLVTGAVLRARGAGRSGSDWELTPPPTGPGVTFRDWRDWALETIGVIPKMRRGVVAGEMVPPPPPGWTTTCPPLPPPASETGPDAAAVDAAP